MPEALKAPLCLDSSEQGSRLGHMSHAGMPSLGYRRIYVPVTVPVSPCNRSTEANILMSNTFSSAPDVVALSLGGTYMYSNHVNTKLLSELQEFQLVWKKKKDCTDTSAQSRLLYLNPWSSYSLCHRAQQPFVFTLSSVLLIIHKSYLS